MALEGCMDVVEVVQISITPLAIMAVGMRLM